MLHYSLRYGDMLNGLLLGNPVDFSAGICGREQYLFLVALIAEVFQLVLELT